MKTLGKITLLATGLAVAYVPFMHAAAENTTATNDSAATATAPVAKHPHHHARMERRAAFRHHLAHKLGLNADQIAKLKAVREKTRADVKAARADSSLTPDQKKAKVRDALQSARADMRNVLTAEQQAKLDALRAKLRHPSRG